MTGAFAFLSWLALGAPTAFAFWRLGRRDLALAAAPFAGLLAITFPAILAAWWPGALSGLVWQAGLASLAIAVASAASLGRGSGTSRSERAGAGPSAVFALGVLALVALGVIGLGEALSRGWPGYGWDGAAIWLVRARVLAESGVLPVALFSEPHLEQGHWDYPLVLPALMAWYARVGGLGVQQMGVPLAHLAAVLPLATALGVRRQLGWPLAAAAGLSPLVVPELLEYHLRAYADPALVMVVTAALAFTVAGSIRWDRGRLVLAGMVWAVAVSIKNEGVLWLCAGAAGAVLLSAYRALPGAAWFAGLARLLGPGFLMFALWRVTCRHLEVEGTLVAGLRWDLVGERIGPVVAALLDHVVTAATAPLLLACVVFILWRSRGPLSDRLLDSGVLLSIPLGFLAGLFVIYAATPHDLDWHILTSLHRTVYGVTPAVFVMALFAGALGRDGG